LAVDVYFPDEVKPCHGVQPLGELADRVCLVDNDLDMDRVISLLFL
jgi:hypothetical protein